MSEHAPDGTTVPVADGVPVESAVPVPVELAVPAPVADGVPVDPAAPAPVADGAPVDPAVPAPVADGVPVDLAVPAPVDPAVPAPVADGVPVELAAPAPVADGVPAEPAVPAPQGKPRRGLQAVNAEEFSFSDAVGGLRGLVETAAPGVVFVTIWVATSHLGWSLGAACATALVAVVLRLVQRTPLTQALGGLLGIGLGVVLAWRSGDAGDFFVPGLWINAAYLAGVLLSILVRWPAVGLVLEAIRTGFTAEKAREAGTENAGHAGPGASPFAGLSAWRSDPGLLRRYTVATWLWVAMFALRLGVQLPLWYLGQVGWLGTARLVLGTPLWGLVLWLTWTVVRGAHDAARHPAHGRTTED